MPLLSDFSSLFDLLPIGAYRSSPEGKQLRANRALVALNGFDTEHEMLTAVNEIGDHWYVDPERRALFQRTVLEKGSVVDFVSEIAAYKSRRRAWIREHAHVVYGGDGQIAYFEGTVEDITAQHDMAIAVDKERELLRTFIQAIPDAAWMVDKEGIYLLTNLAYLARFAPNRSSVVGMHPSALFGPEAADKFQRANERTMALGTAAYYLETVVDPVTGLQTVSDVVKTPMFNSQGEPIGVIGMLRDVTEREQAHTALVAAKEAAEFTAKAKAEFLANMSHEIRTPLNGVIATSELLAATHLNAPQAELASTLLESAHTLMAVLNSVLDFSKIDANQLQLEYVPVDLQQVLLSAQSLGQAAAKAKGLRLTVAVAANTPQTALGDPTRLGQVLNNLVNNAIKFTGSGQVTISVQLLVAGEATGSPTLRFGVQDTGIGIAPDRQIRLFQAFSQVDASTTRRFGGTGLGLVISHRLVAAMGGHLWVESEAGRGSLFLFDVPLHAPSSSLKTAAPLSQADANPSEAAAVAAVAAGAEAAKEAGVVGVAHVSPVSEPVTAPKTSSTPTRTLRILVAEDNAINQKVVSRVLASLGHACQCVADGRLALEAIAAAHESGQPFDVVLMDVQMPEMDGLQAASALRASDADRPRQRPWVVAMTANAMDGDRENCLAHGMDDYLGKPIRISAVQQALENVPVAGDFTYIPTLFDPFALSKI